MKAAGVGWAGVPDASAFVADYWSWLLAAVVAFLAYFSLVSNRGQGRERTGNLEALIPMVVIAGWLIYAMTIVHEMGFAHRFLFVLVPLAALAVTRGLRAILDRALERWPSSARLVTGIGYFAVIGVALFAVGPISSSVSVLRGGAPSDPYITVFTRVGRAISSAGLGEQISFLTGIAGAGPYFAGARHTDALGLASPEFSRVMSLADRTQIV